MNITPHSHSLALSFCTVLLAVAAIPQPSRADSDVSAVIANKFHFYLQTTEGSAADEVDPFTMGISVVGSGPNLVTSANYTPPGGSSTALTSSNGIRFELSGQTDFATQAALDAAFPAGTYAFSIQTINAPTTYNTSLSVTASAYPNAPVLQNTGWAGGLLQINPTQSYHFTWNSGGGNDVFFGIDGVTPWQGLSGIATSFDLVANSLTAGQTYHGALSFDLINYATFENGTGVSSHHTQYLDFGIQATPEPGCFALLGVGGLIIGARRRRN